MVKGGHEGDKRGKVLFYWRLYTPLTLGSPKIFNSLCQTDILKSADLRMACNGGFRGNEGVKGFKALPVTVIVTSWHVGNFLCWSKVSIQHCN